MKKLLAVILFFPVLLAGCSSGCIEDSGIRIAKGMVVKPFDKIAVEGAIKVILKQDSSYAIKIEADSNIMGKIEADVSGSELTLKLEKKSYCGSDTIVIYAGIGELKELTGSGAVHVRSQGLVNGKDLTMKFAGAADVSLELSIANLTTNMDGIGKLNLSGQAGTHKLTTTGSSETTAYNFIAGVYDIHITGNGKASINVLNELKVNTDGSSEIYYKGNPKKVDEKKSGAAKLEKVN
ncbi:MAG: head GIN domain-containing protein [Pedobacter sp.]